MKARIALLFILFTLLLSACQPVTVGTPEILPPPEPIEGWQEIRGNGISAWLPEYFRGGDLNAPEGDALVEAVQALGDEYKDMATSVDKNRKSYALFAFDPNVQSGDLVASLVAGYDTVKADQDLKEYLDVLVGQFPKQYTIIESGVVQMPRYQTVRVLAELKLEEMTVSQVMYIVKSGTLMWQVVFTCMADDLTQYLPIFEQSAASLTFSAVTPTQSGWFSGNPLWLGVGLLLVLGGFYLSWRNMQNRLKPAREKDSPNDSRPRSWR